MQLAKEIDGNAEVRRTWGAPLTLPQRLKARHAEELRKVQEQTESVVQDLHTVAAGYTAAWKKMEKMAALLSRRKLVGAIFTEWSRAATCEHAQTVDAQAAQLEGEVAALRWAGHAP